MRYYVVAYMFQIGEFGPHGHGSVLNATPKRYFDGSWNVIELKKNNPTWTTVFIVSFQRITKKEAENWYAAQT